MIGTCDHIPTLETERLILRAPRIEDTRPFYDFYSSARAKFVGGPNEDMRHSARVIGEISGLWNMRGYSIFVAEVKGDAGTPIASVGPWHPYTWPEMEFGWIVWSGDNEGKGFITEAMRRIIPWTWERTGFETAISVIDEGNEASVRVAEALGATFDPETTARENAEDGAFHSPAKKVRIYRHKKQVAA